MARYEVTIEKTERCFVVVDSDSPGRAREIALERERRGEADCIRDAAVRVVECAEADDWAGGHFGDADA